MNEKKIESIGQKQVQMRYQKELTRYQEQIKKNRKILHLQRDKAA
jgi:hypothetical protein